LLFYIKAVVLLGIAVLECALKIIEYMFCNQFTHRV